MARELPSAHFERCALALHSGDNGAPLSTLVGAIAATGGSSRNFISSDLGQPSSPAYPDGLLSFAQSLVGRGLAARMVREMLVERPAHILGLSA